MKFQLESVDRWAKDARPLYEKHWRELGLDLDLEIAPDIEKMRVMESAGVWKIITARESGELAGYLLALVTKHLHYRNSPPMFIVDAYYMLPEFRKGAGARLFKFAEQLAHQLGAIKMYLSCKVHEDHSELFRALGYRLSDYAFIKRI